MSRLTLLYAEDNQESRENYTFVLKNYFHEVYTAKDGKEALELYYEKKPDVVLLDVTMPLMDGLEVAEAIRKEDNETPIVMLTAHSESDRLLRAVPLHLEQYLLKPIKTKLLQDTMLKLIQKLQDKDMVQLKEGLFWKKMSRELLYLNQHIKLTVKEKLLIEFLCRIPGDDCVRDTLIFHVWHDEIPDVSHDKKLTKLVSRVNKKVMLHTASAVPFIENSYAFGYRLVIEE